MTAGPRPDAAWLQPPPVLPLPSAFGPEGPPRPLGVQPPPGAPPSATGASWARAQSRALRQGPFPAHGLLRGISDGTLLLSEDPAVRAFALSRARAAGVSVVRIPVDWRNRVAADPPPGFDPADSASAAYRLAPIDAAVRDTVAAGLQPLLVVSHAPAFAEAPRRWRFAYPGSWAPSPQALGAFASALARRYDGSFPDPARPGRALPRVRFFQAWNEPNLARYLEPQWIARGGRWQPFSPPLYRQMLNAFYAAVKAADPAAVVVAAGVAPSGDPAGTGRIPPLAFLRSLLCLPADGRHGRARCADPPHFDVLAFHPLSVGDPDRPAASSLDVSVADAAKVATLLRRAQRLHAILPVGAKPLWVTELNWESAPQSSHGVPPRLQAAWLSRALHRLWVTGVGLVDWQFLVDPYPALSLGLPAGGAIGLPRPAGLYSRGAGGALAATPKDFLRGFALPFDPLRIDRHRVRVWALLMHPGQRGLLQRLLRGRWRTVARLQADRWGVVNRLARIDGAASVRLVSGALHSASARVGASP